MRVAAYEPGDAAAWDELAAVAPMATFLHTRRFLDSHGDRLEDASLMLRDGEGNLAGVLPAAVGPGDEGMVATHPGATYGGIVHDGRLTGPAMLEAFEAVRDHYGERGFERLV